MSLAPAPLNSIAGRAGALRSFVCSWSTGGLDAGWVNVAGAIDIATAPQLERALREPRLQSHLVVLDLRDVVFMDSSGVHTIVDASIRAREAGHRLVLLHGSPEVNRLFALTGCSHHVEFGDLCVVEPAAPPS